MTRRLLPAANLAADQRLIEHLFTARYGMVNHSNPKPPPERISTRRPLPAEDAFVFFVKFIYEQNSSIKGLKSRR